MNPIPMTKDMPPPLNQRDYPNIRFWTSNAFDAYCKSLTGETDGLSTQQKRRGQCRKVEDTSDCYPYLENSDGTSVSWEVMIKIGQKARRVWHTLHNIGHAPSSWEKASKTAYNYFVSEMLNDTEFEFFRYCEGNWKVTRWATKAYPSWAFNYIKSKGANDTKVTRVNKRKRELLDNTSLFQIDNETNDGDVTAEFPGPSLIQNAEATQILPSATLLPTQVSSYQISRVETSTET